MQTEEYKKEQKPDKSSEIFALFLERCDKLSRFFGIF